jgi:hypothetical protein
MFESKPINAPVCPQLRIAPEFALSGARHPIRLPQLSS